MSSNTGFRSPIVLFTGQQAQLLEAAVQPRLDAARHPLDLCTKPLLGAVDNSPNLTDLFVTFL